MPHVYNIVIPAHTNSQFILCTRHSKQPQMFIEGQTSLELCSAF